MPFEFVSTQYGPGQTVDTDPDGNCGYYSLSYALTGTVENAREMRRDIVEYIENALRRHQIGREEADWLCKNFNKFLRLL
jgi:hypothetical protein